MVELLRGPSSTSATPTTTPSATPSASPTAGATPSAPAQESSERQSSSSGADTSCSVGREVEPEQRDGNNNQEEEDDISQMAEFMRQRECHQLEELRREVMLVTVV